MSSPVNPVLSMKTEAGKHLLADLLATKWEQPFHRTIPEGGIAIGTHPGFNRSRNEDRAAFASITSRSGQRFFVAMVCDGVGSSEEGHLAATYAIAACFEELLLIGTPTTLARAIPFLVRSIDNFIRERLQGRGTTTASIIIATADGQKAAVNIGDSRIFAWEVQKCIRQISEDDTIENELRKLDMKDPGVIAARGLQGSLSQALGETDRDKEGLQIVMIPEGDLSRGVVLASDGIWKGGQDGFKSIAVFAPSPFEEVRRLLAFATWSGGYDNSTVIAIESTDKITALLCNRETGGDDSSRITAWFADTKFLMIESTHSDPGESKCKNTTPESCVGHSPMKDTNIEDYFTVTKSKKNRSKAEKHTQERKHNIKKKNQEQLEIEISTEENSSPLENNQS